MIYIDLMYWNTVFFSDVLNKIHNSYPTARQHLANQSWGAAELVPHLSSSKALRSRHCEQLCVWRRLRGNSTHYFAAVAVILNLLAIGSNEVERCATITNQREGSLNEQASPHRPWGVPGFLMTLTDYYKCATGSKKFQSLKTHSPVRAARTVWYTHFRKTETFHPEELLEAHKIQDVH